MKMKLLLTVYLVFGISAHATCFKQSPNQMIYEIKKCKTCDQLSDIRAALKNLEFCKCNGETKADCSQDGFRTGELIRKSNAAPEMKIIPYCYWK